MFGAWGATGDTSRQEPGTYTAEIPEICEKKTAHLKFRWTATLRTLKLETLVSLYPLLSLQLTHGNPKRVSTYGTNTCTHTNHACTYQRILMSNSKCMYHLVHVFNPLPSLSCPDSSNLANTCENTASACCLKVSLPAIII